MRVGESGRIELCCREITEMTSYASEVKGCPHCKSRQHVDFCRSCNTINAKFYTDGFVYGPMYDETCFLLVCSECHEYFWLEEGLDETSLDSTSEGAVFTGYAEGVRGSGYEEALRRAPWRNDAQERYVRIRAWWASNDPYREQTVQEFRLSLEQEENLRRLVQLLDGSEPEDLLMKAELYRELGLFKDCFEQLTAKFEDKYSLALNTILEQAALEKRQVEQLLPPEQ